MTVVSQLTIITGLLIMLVPLDFFNKKTVVIISLLVHLVHSTFTLRFNVYACYEYIMVTILVLCLETELFFNTFSFTVLCVLTLKLFVTELYPYW